MFEGTSRLKEQPSDFMGDSNSMMTFYALKQNSSGQMFSSCAGIHQAARLFLTARLSMGENDKGKVSSAFSTPGAPAEPYHFK